MRWAARWIGACLAALTLLIGGVRWIGRWTAPDAVPLSTSDYWLDVVPLPSADGCWLDVCPFRLKLEALPGALEAAPGIVPGSVEVRDSNYSPGSARAVAFFYAPPNAAPQPLVLVMTFRRDRYFIEWDRYAPNRIERLGDLVVVYGAPDHLRLVDRELRLTYGKEYCEHQLNLLVYPFDTDYYDWVRLSRRDTVAGIIAWNPDFPPETGPSAVYYPPSQRWKGFTLYEF